MTFQELGIPFPLFEAPVEEASEFVGKSECVLCSRNSDLSFRLDIGCALIIPCPGCNVENGLDTNDRSDQKCRSCGENIKFPEVNGSITVCYQCLRNGGAAITKDTTLGMVSWEQAFSGVTHGLPGLRNSDFETVQVDEEEDWIGAKVPQELLFELLRTPTYITIQGEQWEFCCKRPMIYVGRWSQDDFASNSPDGNGRAYFEAIVQDAVDGLWEDELHDETGIYVFRCEACNRRTANWDIA